MAEVRRGDDTGEHLRQCLLPGETIAALGALSLEGLSFGERIDLVELGVHSPREALGDDFSFNAAGQLVQQVSPATLVSLRALGQTA
jgi:hypothetical protein